MEWNSTVQILLFPILYVLVLFVEKPGTFEIQEVLIHSEASHLRELDLDSC